MSKLWLFIAWSFLIFNFVLADKLDVDLDKHYIASGENIVANFSINWTDDIYKIRAYLKEAKIGKSITSDCKIGDS